MHETSVDLEKVEANDINTEKFNKTRNTIFKRVLDHSLSQINDQTKTHQEESNKLKFQNGLSANGISKIMDNLLEAFSGSISKTNMLMLAGNDFVDNWLNSNTPSHN